MKIITLLFLIITTLFSKIYYAKVEPYEIRNISSNVSGEIIYIDENKIGKKLSSKAYIKIDSMIDEKELIYLKDNLIQLKNMISSNKKVLKNLELLLEKKRKNYSKVKVLKIKSTVEKDREFYDLIASENQYLNTIKEINNLNVQISDLKLREVRLKKSISDKNISAKGFILYSILVKTGQVVGIATPLAQIADTSKGLLTIYLDEEDLANIRDNKIYLDGLLSKYKISRLLYIADSKNISKYKAQIIINSPKVFSKLVKVELK